MERRKTKKIKVGNIYIGGDAKITVQSMLNRPASDIEGSVRQAVELEKAGCEIIRAAVPDMQAVKLIEKLKESLSVPVVADIHFDYRLALECVAAGVDKIRINSGSLEKELLAEYGSPTPEALVESAMRHAAMLEECDFDDIVISIKSSNVPMMVRAYELACERCDYPLHLGVTEAGTHNMALVKSAAGIGSLLLHGIGDTIRVSMTADPVLEVKAANDILKAVGLKTDCPDIVSCPTCGRTKIDLIALASEVEQRLAGCKKPIKVAVMGCAVNGPGEAREADIGIAGGDGCALIFKKGEIICKVPETEAVDRLMKEIDNL